MKETTIQFWSGLRTIGGNIAELRYGSDRIIFDFGIIFDTVSPLLGNKASVHDLLQLNLLPPIEGIYSRNQLNEPFYHIDTPLAFEESRLNTAIFISHLHLDHMGAVKTIAPNVPLYMSEESSDLYRTLIEIGEESLERDFTSIRPLEQKQIGSISVTPYLVDHDVPGALSYFIETPDLKLLYSGDLRMHGQHPELTESWLEKMAHEQIDILLIEGTSFFPKNDQSSILDDRLSEKEVTKAARDMMRSVDGLVIFNIYHRNIERIKSFIAAAHQEGRQIVLEMETAYIADKLLNESNFVIVERKQIGDVPIWKKDLLKKFKQVSFEEINNHPGKYVLQNSFYHLTDLLDLNLKNALYIHSNGEPLGDYDPNYTALRSFLNRLHVQYEMLNVSGHASEKDILHIIDKIKPKLVIPWHSLHPELVKPLDQHQTIFLPEQKVVYGCRDLLDLCQKNNEKA